MVPPRREAQIVRPPPVRAQASRSRWDAIVVGTGVGGAVTAALLARAGKRVLVLERNAKVGGILASYEKHGFKIDTGSHLVSRGAHGPLGLVLRRLGLEHPRFLTHRIPVRSRGMFEITAPPTRAGLPRVALEAVQKLHLPHADTLRLARMLFEVFTLTELELRRWDRRTLDEFVRAHTEHPGAHFLLSFLASIFFVLPPWEVSAGEAIRCLRWILRDYSLSYVEGGMDSIPHALLGVVAAAGGEIVAPARVAGIVPGAEDLSVVTADGREHIAPLVAANLAPVDLCALVDERALGAGWVGRARALRSSGNAHQLKVGLRRPLVDEGCLIAGVSLGGLTLDDLSIDLMHRVVGAIAGGHVSDPLAVYAPVPTNYDPSLAPPGGGQLIVASLYGPTCAAPADPPEVWRERGLAAMASMIPHLRDELVFAELVPIPAIGRWMGKRERGAICNGQVPGQVGRDRLPVATPVAGLYLVGDGAGGRGVGTELAAVSAMEAVERMLGARREREAEVEAIRP
jgi:prolycopene isomerase